MAPCFPLRLRFEVKYLLTLEYNGEPFEGWQCQPKGNTVQDYLNKAVEKFTGGPVKSVGASRTDSGVHALHQVCMVQVEKQLDEQKFLRSMRALLPGEISVKSVGLMPTDFHPIRDARGKLYRYSIWAEPNWISPFVRGKTWHVYQSLNCMLMQEAALIFVGKKDFSSYAAADGGAKSKVREIYAIEMQLDGPLLTIWVSGSGFLKQMVRNIVGTLVEVGAGKRPASDVPNILAAQDRRAAGITAPAAGLCLAKIYYGNDAPKKALAREVPRLSY